MFNLENKFNLGAIIDYRDNMGMNFGRCQNMAYSLKREE